MSHEIKHQVSSTEYKIQTLLIYNFTKYVKWSSPNEKNEFTIVVYGESPILNFFNQLKDSKQINGKSIVIKTIKPGEKIPTCELLYIDDHFIHQAENQINENKLPNTLVITNTTPIPLKISCINLKLVNDNYKFEINSLNTTNNNLEVSSNLLNLAIKIYK